MEGQQAPQAKAVARGARSRMQMPALHACLHRHKGPCRGSCAGMHAGRDVPRCAQIGVIPARYQSARFPGKPLVSILGKPMVVRTWEQALKASTLSKVIVATDSEKIAETCRAAGAEVVMTSDTCPNGVPPGVPTPHLPVMGMLHCPYWPDQLQHVAFSSRSNGVPFFLDIALLLFPYCRPKGCRFYMSKGLINRRHCQAQSPALLRRRDGAVS